MTNGTHSIESIDRRKNISIMSWNIQDSIGDKTNKFETSEFLSILSPHSIMCLQETKIQVKIEGHASYNSCRNGSRSGGVCILVKNNIRKGVKKLLSVNVKILL